MIDSTSLFEKSLVVDSSFSSRKTLINDLKQGSLCKEIIEAQSIANGLEILSSNMIDACLIGPSLSEERAIDFIQQGRSIPSTRLCAFIAITSSDDHNSQRLIQAGAHETICKPYSIKTFTSIVRSAIEKAHLVQLSAQSTNLIEDVLTSTAVELAEVSSLVKTGKLKLDSNNQPSLASRDAIRLAIEKAFISPDNEVHKIGSFDHHFVTCIVEWFSEHAATSPATQNPTENLRQRLLEFYKNSLKDFINANQ